MFPKEHGRISFLQKGSDLIPVIENSDHIGARVHRDYTADVVLILGLSERADESLTQFAVHRRVVSVDQNVRRPLMPFLAALFDQPVDDAFFASDL